jgi:hypothetical protein
VEVEHDRRARVTRGREPSRANERQHVVDMDDVGAELAHRRGDVLLIVAPSQQRARGAGTAGVRGAPLEQRMLHTRPLQGPQLELDRALLAPLYAVAVVYDEDTESDGTTLSGRWTRPR